MMNLPPPPFFVDYSRVEVFHGYPNTVERGHVIYQDGYKMEALLHFYRLHDPSAVAAVQWHQLVAQDGSNHFLKVLGIRYNTEQDLGYSHLIVFTEDSDSTLFQWGSMNQLHVQYVAGGFNYLSNPCSSKLSDVYGALLYLRRRLGAQHGKISAENIFISDDKAKLGAIDLQPRKDDIEQFIDMVVGFGLNTIYEMSAFLRSLQDNSVSNLWLENNIRNGLGHPVFKQGGCKRLKHRSDLQQKLVDLTLDTDSSKRLLYSLVEQQLRNRLAYIDWISVIQSMGLQDPNNAFFRVYNYNPQSYKRKDPLAFARYGRNFKVHKPFGMSDEVAEEGLNRLYPDYLPTIHEIMSGLGIFVEDPPY